MSEKLMRYHVSSMWSEKWFPGRNGAEDVGAQGNIGDCFFSIGKIQQVGKRFKFNFCVAWEPIGRNCESASNKARICDFIAELPSADSLDDLKSLQQLFHWINTKTMALRFAKCWESGENYPDNPLARDLEEGLIDQWTHDFIWLQSFWQQNLWALIHLKYKDIRAKLQSQGEYPFQSDRELFQEILRDQVDSYFLKSAKSLYSEKATEIKLLGDLKARELSGTLGDPNSKKLRGVAKTNELKKLRELESYYASQQVWLNRVLKAAGELSQQDALIHTLMASYNNLLFGITKLHQDSYHDPALKQHGQVTSTWERGINTKGIELTH